MKQKELQSILSSMVDGRNSNALSSVVPEIESYIKCKGDERVKLSTLVKVLSLLSKKWEKEIDEVISSI
jgi:hypothetical protein